MIRSTAAALILSSGLHAVPVLTDTFDSDVENWSTDDHSVTQSDGQLIVLDDGGAGATRAFSPLDSSVTLAVGEQLAFSAEVLFTSTGSGVPRALNIAFSNGDGTTAYVNRVSCGSLPYAEGHYLNGSLGASDNNLIADVGPLDDVTPLGSLATMDSIRTDFVPNDGYSHTVRFVIARSGPTTLELVSTVELGDGSYRIFSTTDSAATQFTFSRVDIGTFGNSNYDFNLDDVVVEYDTTPSAPTITAFDYDSLTGDVTVRFTDTGATTYTIESDDDLDFTSSIPAYPLDGTEDTSTYPGEVEFTFFDPDTLGPKRFWRVRAD